LQLTVEKNLIGNGRQVEPVGISAATAAVITATAHITSKLTIKCIDEYKFHKFSAVESLCCNVGTNYLNAEASSTEEPAGF